MKRLVLLGGGHAHVEVLRRLAGAAVPEWQVTLVSPAPAQIYSGMLPGVIAGHYAFDDCLIDLAALAGRAKATFWPNAASLVSPEAREVMLADGNVLPYDLLSIDIGGRTFVGEARGVERNAVPVRPLDRFVEAWDRVLGEAARGAIESVSLVGGGAAGIELALAMHHRLAGAASKSVHVRVVSDAPELASEFARGARRRLRRVLTRRGIGVHLGAAVAEVKPRELRLENGMTFVSDATFWSAGAAAPDLPRDSGFAVDEKGYLVTDDRLRSVSHPGVFAAGDCAVQQRKPVPRAGVFAVRAGPPLAANIHATMTGAPLGRHDPSERYLALVSAGAREAVGVWNGFSWEGAWVWRWKDRIDRAFIARYREPPA